MFYVSFFAGMVAASTGSFLVTPFDGESLCKS